MKNCLSENAVEAAVIQFMQACGWRATRNHVGNFHPYKKPNVIVKIGTEGFPDWTFTRPLQSVRVFGKVELMHFEAKAPGKKPSAIQFEVMASLNCIGELAVWADSLERFKEVYYMYFPSDHLR